MQAFYHQPTSAHLKIRDDITMLGESGEREAISAGYFETKTCCAMLLCSCIMVREVLRAPT